MGQHKSNEAVGEWLVAGLSLGGVRLFFSTLLLNVDSELLGFLVEVAAFQAERLSCIRDVVIASLELG
jgi:hypothetical protein